MIVNLPGEGKRGFQSHFIALCSSISYPLFLDAQTESSVKRLEKVKTELPHTTAFIGLSYNKQTNRQQTHGQTMSKKD